MLSKGNYHYFLFYTSIHTSTPLWEFSEYQSGVGWELSAAGAESGAWHHIAGVRNGSSQRLYIDGIPVDSTGFTYNAAAPSDMGYDLVIGRFLQDFSNNNYCFFDGMIDEVRICSVDRGDDWLRMSYENQKSGSTLLHFMVNQE